jgi:hypothetical protein
VQKESQHSGDSQNEREREDDARGRSFGSGSSNGGSSSHRGGFGDRRDGYGNRSGRWRRKGAIVLTVSTILVREAS